MASELHGGVRGEIQQLCMPAAAALRRTTATIECPKSMVGRVIGKNGETIKALQTYTGSLIQVNQVDNPCQITISGSPQSLSLAVSMVADIVKGTFKGFALLRQVASPSTMPRSYASFPQQQLPMPQPVYAPGYGLIPPSQLYGAEDRVAAAGGLGTALGAPPGFAWATTGAAGAPPVLLGLQPGLSQHTFSSSAGILNGMAGSTTSLPVFGMAGSGYSGLPYYHQADLGGVTTSGLLYADGAGGMFAAGMPGVGLSDHSAAVGVSNSAKLIHAAGAAAGPHSAHQLGRGGSSAASSWLPHTGNAVMASVTSGNFPSAGSSTIVSDLLDSGGAAGANGGAPGATSSGQASVGPSSSGTATTPGGNLVMDADGKVYYVNTL